MQIIHVINLAGKVGISGLGTCTASVTSRAWEEEGDIQTSANGKGVRRAVRSKQKFERVRLSMRSRCDDVADGGYFGDFSIVGKGSASAWANNNSPMGLCPCSFSFFAVAL